MPARTRLRLEPVTDEHLPLLVELNSDPDVMRFILGRAATPAESADEWRRRRELQSDPARGLGYWVGFSAGGFVGWWSASSFATDPAQAGLGYRLVRSAWGRGLATHGADRMVERAFSCPDIERVVASTMAVNAASRRVLTKAGLRHVDTWVGDWEEPIEGWEQGEVGYQLTRDEWTASRTSAGR
jgi:RimJ/RimL family protein N-acetyltransferase